MKLTNHHVSDLVVRLKNCSIRGIKHTLVPNIKINKYILKVLHEEGYINEIVECGRAIKVFLKYINGVPVVKTIGVVSKPSYRVFKKVNEIPLFYNGLGLTIVSTSKGIITDAQARELNVGGEILCQVF